MAKSKNAWADHWVSHAMAAADLLQGYIDVICEKTAGLTLDDISNLLKSLERAKPKGIEEKAAYFILRELLFEELTDRLKEHSPWRVRAGKTKKK